MSDTANPQTQAPLGVGALISDTFSVFFKRLGAVVGLAFIPFLLYIFLVVALTRAGVIANIEDPTLSLGTLTLSGAVTILLAIVVYNFVTSMFVQLAYDTKLDRGPRYGAYFSTALRNLVPVTILGIAAFILIALGLVALIIPGLWVYALFSVMVPAVVIEGVGFNGLSRSAELTKNYRWPVFGALFLIGLIGGIIGFGFGFVNGLLAGVSIWVGIVLETVTNAITYSLGSIMVALIYARLREIKEGVGVEDIVSVFD